MPSSNSYYEGDIDPEEIFRAFFGGGLFGQGGFHQQRPRQRQRQHREDQEEHAQHPQQNKGFTVLLQLIAFIFISMMFSGAFFNTVVDSLMQQEYSLRRSSSFPSLRRTSRLNVPYFVKQGFEREYNARAIKKVGFV